MGYETVTVVGAGLAGSEAALQLADRGIKVKLIEMRPQTKSPAHHTSKFAELVCSNSLKSTKPDTAAGLLKAELTKLNSRLLDFARKSSVAAGGALAVDRDKFSSLVTDAIYAHENIEVVVEEATSIPEGVSIIAAGPLCSEALFNNISEQVGSDNLSFFDAAAPIVSAESLNFDVVFSQSRYDTESTGDYLNCPMNKEEYETFLEALLGAKRVINKDFESKDLFQACQPVEEVAKTGHDSIRFGALKPVGLIDPRTGKKSWAVVQLRSENEYKTAYNLVGFQTNLTWGEQARVFRLIPGLEHAEFLRYGVMHRNSFINSPKCLTPGFRIPNTSTFLAGQITGTEGYVEAIASGLMAALNAYAAIVGEDAVVLPNTGSLGSLFSYALNPQTKQYQPMHVNFGLFPPLAQVERKKDLRRQKMIERAEKDFDAYLSSRPEIFGVL